MVLDVIVNGVGYVKYKNCFLNYRLSLPSGTRLAMMHIYEASDGDNVICHCVSIAAISLPTHITPHNALLT